MKNFTTRRPPDGYIAALTALHQPVNPRRHFGSLSRDEQHDAIRCMAAQGHTEYAISHATGIAVEMIRQLLAQGAER